jgi:hypothetical protein
MSSSIRSRSAPGIRPDSESGGVRPLTPRRGPAYSRSDTARRTPAALPTATAAASSTTAPSTAFHPTGVSVQSTAARSTSKTSCRSSRTLVSREFVALRYSRLGWPHRGHCPKAPSSDGRSGDHGGVQPSRSTRAHAYPIGCSRPGIVNVRRSSPRGDVSSPVDVSASASCPADATPAADGRNGPPDYVRHGTTARTTTARSPGLHALVGSLPRDGETERPRVSTIVSLFTVGGAARNSCPTTAGCQLLRRTVRPHHPIRMHRPDPDLQRTPRRHTH